MVDHRVHSREQGAHKVDVIIRVMSDGHPYLAIPLTATLCIAAAAKMEGSVTEQYIRRPFVED